MIITSLLFGIYLHWLKMWFKSQVISLSPGSPRLSTKQMKGMINTKIGILREQALYSLLDIPDCYVLAWHFSCQTQFIPNLCFNTKVWELNIIFPLKVMESQNWFWGPEITVVNSFFWYFNKIYNDFFNCTTVLSFLLSFVAGNATFLWCPDYNILRE